MKAAGTIFAQSWSPDDQRLAAVERSPDTTSTRVHLVEVKTGKVETLPQPAGEPVVRNAHPLVGGQRLALLAYRFPLRIHAPCAL